MNEWEWHVLEDKTQVEQVTIAGVDVKLGDRVRLRPRQGGDVLDIALAGQIAIIESLEQDYEGKNHVCVVLEEDPGRDLGMLRQPGHRFFFSAEEIEPLPVSEAQGVSAAQQARILIHADKDQKRVEGDGSERVGGHAVDLAGSALGGNHSNTRGEGSENAAKKFRSGRGSGHTEPH